ncbi:unnamed protein product [Gordionus sp. m RMFG-2023]
MPIIFELEDLREYKRSFKIYALNGSLNCTIHRNLKLKTLTTMKVFVYVAPILLILGIIGNALGLYCAMRDKIIYIRVYLTRVFHAVNLVNYIFMLIYPVIMLIAKFHLVRFINQLPWNIYLVDYHFSIAKTLINFSFGIYVIFGISQMMAIAYPHYYKSHFTLRKIKIMIVICFLYYSAWYIPSAWWFQILKFNNVCGLDPQTFLYIRIFASFTKTERREWTIFGIFREIFTRFIPIGALLLLNYISLKHKRLKIRWRFDQVNSNLQVATSSNTNEAVIFPEFERNSRKELTVDSIKPELTKSEHNVSLTTTPSNINDIALIDRIRKKIVDTIDITNSKTSSRIISKPDFKTDSIGQRKVKQMELEYKISIRMLAILMLEFLVFLLPVSIYLILVDFFDYLVTAGESEIAFASCTLMEYAYISSTFYLNMIFNPAYRQDVYRIFRKSKLGKFYKKHKKNSIGVERSN